METAVVKYIGDLRTEAIHLKSNEKMITDAPTDNNGKGEAFSPTDLLSSALASCMLTIMGIVAKRHDIDINNTTATVTKIMAENPRRVDEIKVEMMFPRNYNDNEKTLLTNAALTCPVAKSLHPDLKQTVSFKYA